METFAQLRLPPDPGADPHLLTDDHGYKLVVTGADITRGIGLRFPWVPTGSPSHVRCACR